MSQMIQKRLLGAMSLCLPMIAGPAVWADSLQFFGGFGASVGNQVVYANDYTTPDILHRFDYGTGGFAGAAMTIDYGPLGRPLMVEMIAGQVTGQTATPGAYSLDSWCYPGIETLLGLVHDCQDSAIVDHAARYASVSATTPVDLTRSTQLSFGLSTLSLNTDLGADYFYPQGMEHFVDRDAGFQGLGLVLGLSQDVPLGQHMRLELAATGSLLVGQRSLSIRDIETYNGIETEVLTYADSEIAMATTVELRPSLTVDANWLAPDASFSLGLSHRVIGGAVNTANVVDHGYPAGSIGKSDDDFRQTSAFLGLSFPLR